MHELSLVHSLLDIVREHSRQHGFSRVNVLRLQYGRLSCIDRQAIEFAFSVLSPGTAAAGAHLEFDIVPGRIYCFGCGAEFEQERFTGVCPGCGAAQVHLTGGTEELQLVEMDVD